MLQVKELTLGEGQPKICVPLVGNTTEELQLEAEKANQTAADIIEWRVDYFENVHVMEDVLDALTVIREALPQKVLLFTFRTKEEGGEKAMTLTEYQQLCLSAAASQKIDLIDVELARVEFLGRGFVAALKENKVKIIMSSHDFEKTPDDATLVFRINVMNQFGADIGKLATMPQQLQDVLRIMGIVSKARGFNQLPLAVMAMGDLGKVTRITGEITGSVFTFGSLDQASAPGQIPVAQLKEILETLRVTEK
ncbi:type I 3-dehydroquinate dehydratase [Enterococcus olivae]